MLLRKLNQSGIDTFRSYLANARITPNLPTPSILEDDQQSEVIGPDSGAIPPSFINRMDFADWLHNLCQQHSWNAPRRDEGFWSWLTLLLFDHVCPADSSGRRTIREDAWYLPAFEDSRRHYRHVLFGSYEVYYQYRDDPETAAVLLSVGLTTLGHFWFQLASRQELLTNPAVVAAATSLYMDRSSRKAKRGATTQNPGAIFRFVKVLNQLDRVWDLRLKGASGILDLLPAEFDKFKA